MEVWLTQELKKGGVNGETVTQTRWEPNQGSLQCANLICWVVDWVSRSANIETDDSFPNTSRFDK